MKKLKYILLLLMPLQLFAQFDVVTEYRFLKLINKQHNIGLIKSNTTNAEIAASHFYLSKEKKKNSLFFDALANSFSISKTPDKAVFYALVQRILFPNDSIANKSKFMFQNNALSTGLSTEKMNTFWNSTVTEKQPKSREEQMLLVISLAVKLHSKNLKTPIKTLGAQLEQQHFVMPTWYNDWKFLTQIKIREKRIKKLFYFENTAKSSLFECLKGKDKRYVYTKAIRYYTKSRALPKAKTLIKAYKALKLPFYKRMAIPYKKLRIFIKSI